MILDRNTIFYFSGTGNSLKVAKDIVDILKNAEVSAITNIKETIVIDSEILGLVFPVYYARLPLVVERFIENLEINKRTYIFVVATSGGTPGYALKRAGKILANKNNKLNSAFTVTMPSNNIFSYNPSSPKRAEKILKKELEKVKKISSIVGAKQNCKPEYSKVIIDRVVDVLFKNATDKIMKQIPNQDNNFWVTSDCDGCGFCEKICPVNNIEIIADRPSWKHKCECCTACIQRCPKEAIQWGEKTLKRRRYKI